MENNIKPNYQCVMSTNLAKLLIEKGFVVKSIAPDRANTERTVFFFDKSESLFKEIEKYKSKK